MTMREVQTQQRVVQAVAAHMQARFDAHASQEGRAAFLTRVARRPRRTGLALPLIATTAAVVVLLAWPRPLTVVSKDVSLGEGLRFQAGARAAELMFSDGSQVTLEPGAEGSLPRLDSHGADLRLSSGEVSLKVEKRKGARWAVLAGPYTVRVTGTHFQVRWVAQAGRFAIHMWEGHVVVQGPGLPLGHELSSGESLTLPAEPVPIAAPAAGAPPARAAEAEAAPAPAAAVPAPVVAPAPTMLPSRALESRWPGLVGQGKYQLVLAEASRQGLPRVLKRASLAELAALADAGRYGGDPAVAEQALLTQRKKFPHTERAVLAAYLLGRLAEDAGQPRAAVAWYDRYLQSGSHQALAEESLGRKMLALDRAGLVDAARMAARAYKRQYPNGSFFRAADRIEAIHSRE